MTRKATSRSVTETCPDCGRMFFSDAYVESRESYGVSFDLDRHTIITMRDGREFPVLSMLAAGGCVGGFVTASGMAFGALFRVSPDAILAMGGIATVAGMMIPVAMAVYNFDVKLHLPDIDVKSWLPTGKNSLRNIELPSGIPGIFETSDYVRFAQAVIERGISDEKLARGNDKVCSQRQYSKLLEWMIAREFVQKRGQGTTSGYELTELGQDVFEHVASYPLP